VNRSIAAAGELLRRDEHLHRAAAAIVSARRRALRRRDAERLLTRRFRQVTGRELDLDNPTTFTEKLYWRMIIQHRYPDPRFTALADKYSARLYVESLLGPDALPQLFWHGRTPAEIPFDDLPDRYVIRTSHGSGQVVRVVGHADRASVIADLSEWLATNYYWRGREDQYYRITPRLLIEELLDDGYPDGPLDYRFFCFDGSPVLVQVSDHSHAVHLFFDLEWNPLEMWAREADVFYPVSRPSNLAEMTRAAATLSEGFDFVRVDLYSVADRTLVGELTFTPNRGLKPFHPESVEHALGHLWVLDFDRTVPRAGPGTWVQRCRG
jgi:hypothetical protein